MDGWMDGLTLSTNFTFHDQFNYYVFVRQVGGRQTPPCPPLTESPPDPRSYSLGLDPLSQSLNASLLPLLPPWPPVLRSMMPRSGDDVGVKPE